MASVVSVEKPLFSDAIALLYMVTSVDESVRAGVGFSRIYGNSKPVATTEE